MVETKMRASIEPAGATGHAPAVLADEGRVHEAIVHRAATLRADLLVMGTHGRGGFNRLLLGSVTEKVVRIGSCLVLTIPPSAPHEAHTPVRFKNIICPVDFSASALKALEYALELGRQSAGRLTVLHSIEYLDEDEPGPYVDAELRSYRRQLLDHAREPLHALMAKETQTSVRA